MIATKKELDEKDKKIIELSGEGKTAKEIGYIMNLSAKSVAARKTKMFQYFKVSSITELVLKISKLEQ